jgi:hypothetical protein
LLHQPAKSEQVHLLEHSVFSRQLWDTPPINCHSQVTCHLCSEVNQTKSKIVNEDFKLNVQHSWFKRYRSNMIMAWAILKSTTSQRNLLWTTLHWLHCSPLPSLPSSVTHPLSSQK